MLSVIFPCLFRLARTLDISVAEAWLIDYEIWDLHFRRNLTESKIQERASLSTILSSVRLQLVLDAW